MYASQPWGTGPAEWAGLCLLTHVRAFRTHQLCPKHSPGCMFLLYRFLMFEYLDTGRRASNGNEQQLGAEGHSCTSLGQPEPWPTSQQTPRPSPMFEIVSMPTLRCSTNEVEAGIKLRRVATLNKHTDVVQALLAVRDDDVEVSLLPLGSLMLPPVSSRDDAQGNCSRRFCCAVTCHLSTAHLPA